MLEAACVVSAAFVASVVYVWVAPGLVLLARLSWRQHSGRIERVWYPVFPPDRHGSEVLASLIAEDR